MSFPIFIADAFVGQIENRILRGNPAAVAILEEFFPDEQLQEVAAEFNLSETALLRQRANNNWDLRWLTPTTEVDLCGHATLASAHVLWQSGRAQGETLNFYTRNGILSARKEGAQIALEFPLQPVNMANAPPELIEAIGLRAGADPFVTYRAADDWLIKVARGRVETLRPNFALLQQLSASLQMRGVIVTCGAPRGADYDFASRFFAPGIGVAEDPATGSTHTKLATFWGHLLKKEALTAVQLSERGGLLHLKLRGKNVEIRGESKIRVRGQWL